MRRLFYAFAGVFLIMTAGCSGGSNGSKEPTAKIGDPAPAFSVEATDGSTVRLEDFKGKPLVLTFMAEWCPCSNKSAPVFKEAYAEYHPRGVEFMIFGFQDSRSKFSDFVKRQAIPFPAAYDSGDAVGASFGVLAPPTTFFITPDGKVQRAFYGKIEERDKLFGWIDELVARKATPPEEKKGKKEEKKK